MPDSAQLSISELERLFGGDCEMARALVENSNDFIGLASLDGRSVFVNPAGRRLVGLGGVDEVQVFSMADYVLAEDRDKLLHEALPAAVREGRWDGEIRFRHFRTGAAIPMLQQVFLIKETGSGRPLAFATISRDISLLGELIASIAHEISQPLGAIANNSHVGLCIAAAGPGLPGRLQELLSDIVQDANRASEIISRIRTMTKRTAPNKSLLQLRVVITDVLALADCELAERGTDVRSEIPEDLPRVSGDRVQLQQVFLNLVMNAVEAMSEVGPGRRFLLITGRPDELIGQPAVRIAVQDSGRGLRSQDCERLFEAFYTTKPNGMGMGLRISRSIVEAHGGRLWGAPNTGSGATFTCLFPVESRT